MNFSPRNLIALNVWSGGQRADTRDGPLQTVRRLADPGPMPRACQWPLWDDQERATHRYCGKANAAGRVYCHEHCDRAFLGYKQTRMPGLATSGGGQATRVPHPCQAGAVGSNAVPAAPMRKQQDADDIVRPRRNVEGGAKPLERVLPDIDLRLCVNERERQMVRLWNQPNSKSQRAIATMLGISHNVVSGVLHRIRKREVEE